VTATREAVLAEVLAALESRLRLFTASGLADLVEELRDHDGLSGERVRVGDVEGVGAGVDAGGALLVRDDIGRVHRVTSGTVERR
jgi:biotin-(acetyl-CoA carboxylase) ligase